VKTIDRMANPSGCSSLGSCARTVLPVAHTPSENCNRFRDNLKNFGNFEIKAIIIKLYHNMTTYGWNMMLY